VNSLQAQTPDHVIKHRAVNDIFVANIMKKRLKAAHTQTVIMNTCDYCAFNCIPYSLDCIMSHANLFMCHVCKKIIYFLLFYTHSAPIRVAAKTYFGLGISASTKKAYLAGHRQYTTFCSVLLTPLSEDTLMLFATHLVQQDLSSATIQVYLSAVRYSCTTAKDPIPAITKRLRYIFEKHM